MNINKEFLGKFKDEEELIVYFSINDVNNDEKRDINLGGKTFLFYKNDTNFIIPEDNYINDNLLINNKNNYNLYHLKLEGEDKKNYTVEFSSNADLDNEGLYISFLDYENIKNIKSENLLQNSSNIQIINSEIRIGAIHHFEFTINKELNDIILCVGTKLKKEKNGLSNVNYIFKYMDKDSQKFNYKLNNEIKYIDSGANTRIQFERIKTISSDDIETPNAEIYIRKIKNKLNGEIFNTISIIESDYDLVSGKISNSNEKIVVDIPKIKENEIYSILINVLGTNEKFVYDIIIKEEDTPSDKPSDTPSDINSDTIDEDDDDDNKILVIVSISFAIIVLIIIIIFVLCYYKGKGRNLQNDVMKTSFENTGFLDESNDKKE